MDGKALRVKYLLVLPCGNVLELFPHCLSSTANKVRPKVDLLFFLCSGAENFSPINLRHPRNFGARSYLFISSFSKGEQAILRNAHTTALLSARASV